MAWLSAHPATNVLLGVLFVVLALSLFGMYELTLPNFLARRLQAKQAKGGVVGTVFGALAFTVISFTCVAPFLGGFAGISAADSGSLALSRGVASGLAVFVLLPSLYTAWSVQRYFGLARAAGGDHFRRRYREMPLVTRGAFAWTPNAMYTFGFLGLWAIALFARSHAGLVAALFQHAYIWVHYVCTEQPDMARLYGEPAAPRG